MTTTVSTFTAPSDAPALFYRFKLGGIDNPGVIARGGVSGWGIVSEYDVKKGKGADDATITDTGDKPAKGKIKYLIWRKGVGDTGQDDTSVPNDFEEDDAFVRFLRDARRNKQALDIVHPIINQCEVRSIVIEEIGQLTEEGSNGLWSRELSCLKWVEKPTSGGGTPEGAKAEPEQAGGQLDPEPNGPNAALKKEFADKFNQAFGDQAADEGDG